MHAYQKSRPVRQLQRLSFTRDGRGGPLSNSKHVICQLKTH